MLLLIQKYIKISVRIKAPNSVNTSKRKHKNQINHYNKQRRVLMANSTLYQSKWKPINKPRRAKPKTYRQAPTQWLKFYKEAIIESEARTAVLQLKSEADWVEKHIGATRGHKGKTKIKQYQKYCLRMISGFKPDLQDLYLYHTCCFEICTIHVVLKIIQINIKFFC